MLTQREITRTQIQALVVYIVLMTISLGCFYYGHEYVGRIFYIGAVPNLLFALIYPLFANRRF